MTDLVKRLRARRISFDFGEEHDLECHEAASRIEKLVAALRPFAEWADAYEPDEGDEHELAWNHRATIGMLRAARKALEGKDD
jgi:hypothetical protein